ncbi:MAG: PLP-dependent aminotransferase family protein [Betaproteobacteria bacterium]|nr:PLP-dependent aminotransferase family protein [Betaproteobacteria bacterium]
MPASTVIEGPGAAGAARAGEALPAGFLAARPSRGSDAALPEASARTWVYRHVSSAIVEGLLWPGLRLPSARELSRAWSVARGAVDEALMRLAREGLIERRAGRGSFIARRLPPGMVHEVSGRGALARQAGEALDGLAPLLRLGAPPGQGPPQERRYAGARPMLDPRVPDVALFPLPAWRRCMGAAHAEADRASLFYGLPAGWPALREATARHLALTRALECSADQVIILNGPLQALDLVVRVLLEPGDAVVVERPGYMSIARTVGLPPVDLHGAPVDDEGLDVEAARRACPAPSLIYVHPLHQYPTGARLSAPRRVALLAWARACRAWVIEGDHLGEIVHDGAVPPALAAAHAQRAQGAQGAQGAAAAPTPGPHAAATNVGSAEPAASALDDGNPVLFLGSFNGVMFPALRLSYLVVPRRLVPAFTAVRGLFGDHPPLALQQALARFMQEGHLSAHLRRMRGVYRERRDAALDAVARHLPEPVRVGPLLGGTHGCLHLPPGCADEPLAQRLGTDGFATELLSAYSWPQRGSSGLVFGYGADDPARIDAAMRQLGGVLREVLGPRPTARAVASGPAPHGGGR